MSRQAVCWIDGELMPANEAKVSVFDHGFLYGDGVFEGVRFYSKNLFRWPLHWQRLRDSAAALSMTIPLSELAMRAAIVEAVNACAFDDGYLRIIVTRGIGALGINPDSCVRPSVVVIADGLEVITEVQRERGIRTIIASTRRNSPDRLDSRIKSLNYLNAIFARIEANVAGVEEAILLNDRGFVAEGTVDNIFIVKHDRLITPPVTEGALAGITRHTLLILAEGLGMETKEDVLTPYDLYIADEVILTGTGAKLIPVREVAGRAISSCPGPVYRQLSEAFSQLIEQECRSS